jgi:hypothetical protein
MLSVSCVAGSATVRSEGPRKGEGGRGIIIEYSAGDGSSFLDILDTAQLLELDFLLSFNPFQRLALGGVSIREEEQPRVREAERQRETDNTCRAQLSFH